PPGGLPEDRREFYPGSQPEPGGPAAGPVHGGDRQHPAQENRGGIRGGWGHGGTAAAVRRGLRPGILFRQAGPVAAELRTAAGRHFFLAGKAGYAWPLAN